MVRVTKRMPRRKRNEFERARPRVRGEDGKRISLKWNEPRPDMAVRPIASVRVARANLGLAGVRLGAEEILRSGCGEREIVNRLQRLGSSVADVLVKLATSRTTCNCGPSCTESAIAALAYFPTAAAADCLQRIASDARADVAARVTALTAMGQIGAPSGIEYLLSVLTAARDPAMRRAAARGLGRSSSPTALGALSIAAEKDSNPLVRQMAHAAAMEVAGANHLPLSGLKPPPRPRLARPERRNPPKGAST